MNLVCIWFVDLAEKINPLRALKVWVSRYFGFVGSAEENQSASGDDCVFANASHGGGNLAVVDVGAKQVSCESMMLCAFQLRLN